jgi:hypothetical protein
MQEESGINREQERYAWRTAYAAISKGSHINKIPYQKRKCYLIKRKMAVKANLTKHPGMAIYLNALFFHGY